MSIGDTLAGARRQAGLTVTQVSQQTRIRETIIRDIEQDDFTQCGGDFYARGHIRSIAGAIGTDPAPLISEYDADHGPVSAMRAADVFGPTRPIKIRERRSPSLAMIVALVLLAVIGFGAYRLVSSRGHSGHPAAAPTLRPPSASVAAKPKTSSTPPPQTPSDVVIKVDALREDCWVLLTKASDGSQIFMGVVSVGTSMTWTEQEAVNIRLGNPGGIVLTVDGHTHPIKTLFPVTLSFSPQGSASASPSSSASG